MSSDQHNGIHQHNYYLEWLLMGRKIRSSLDLNDLPANNLWIIELPSAAINLDWQLTDCRGHGNIVALRKNPIKFYQIKSICHSTKHKINHWCFQEEPLDLRLPYRKARQTGVRACCPLKLHALSSVFVGGFKSFSLQLKELLECLGKLSDVPPLFVKAEVFCPAATQPAVEN